MISKLIMDKLRYYFMQTLKSFFMKKLSVFKASAILILSSAMVMSLVTSCEGPEGVAGVDANETCKQCHNGESVLIAKINQAANSQHQLGITSFENASSCAPCHTSQGFIEALANDTTATVAAISNPVAINCRTCHDIHKEYDSTDFALRSEAPVKLRLIAETLDLGGPSNLCANCHQPRSVAVYPVAGGANISVTSSRLPGHYGTQSTMLAGMAGYEVAGSADYPSAANPHKAAGCVTCHMAEPVGSLTGGHTFRMENEEEGPNLAGCVACHPSAKDFDIDGTQTDIAALLADLNAALVADGILKASGSVNASSTAPLSLSPDKYGALLNFAMVKNDGSMGVHNPAYAKALLSNSIEVFN